MSDRITLQFGANTREVERGADRMSDSLKDTEASLDDVGKAGQQAGEDAAGGLSKAGDAADDVGGKLGDLAGVGRDVLEGDIAGAAESAATTLTGFAALIPGIGTLIGSALGTIASGFIDIWSEAAKKNEDRWRAMYADMTESGNAFLSNEAINRAIYDLVQNESELNRIKEDAATAGIRLSLALRAEAGDSLALSSAIQQVRDRRDELNTQQDAYIAKNGDVNAQIDYQIGTLDLLEQSYESLAGQTESVAEASRVYTEATENAGEATGNLTDKLNSVPESVYAGVEVDTSKAEADLQAFIGRRRPSIPLHIEIRQGKQVLN